MTVNRSDNRRFGKWCFWRQPQDRNGKVFFLVRKYLGRIRKNYRKNPEVTYLVGRIGCTSPYYVVAEFCNTGLFCAEVKVCCDKCSITEHCVLAGNDVDVKKELDLDAG